MGGDLENNIGGDLNEIGGDQKLGLQFSIATWCKWFGSVCFRGLPVYFLHSNPRRGRCIINPRWHFYFFFDFNFRNDNRGGEHGELRIKRHDDKTHTHTQKPCLAKAEFGKLTKYRLTKTNLD